jgi:hopanoid-associated phosphorylase
MTVGILVGMRSEADVVGHKRGLVAVSGGIAAKSLDLARRLLANPHVDGIVSFGIAGGLHPDLHPGDVIVGDWVAVEGQRIACDGVWTARLVSALHRHVQGGGIAGAAVAVTSAQDKAALYRETGALAVDLESGAAAVAAREAGKKLAVVRVVADPASRALPRAALVGLGEDGETRPWEVVKALAGSPGDLPGLIRLAFDSNKAMAALGRAVAALDALGA